jgi:hypothetical protein
VIDGPQSVVFDQAENRMHVQNTLLINLPLPEIKTVLPSQLQAPKQVKSLPSSSSSTALSSTSPLELPAEETFEKEFVAATSLQQEKLAKKEFIEGITGRRRRKF